MRGTTGKERHVFHLVPVNLHRPNLQQIMAPSIHTCKHITISLVTELLWLVDRLHSGKPAEPSWFAEVHSGLAAYRAVLIPTKY